MRFYRTLALIAICGLLTMPAVADARQSRPLIQPFQSVSGELNDTRTTQMWEFNGQVRQVVSLVARTTSGDLDVVVELYDPRHRLMAANDNETFDSTDARIEAITLPADGTYLVQVYREGLEYGTTTGTYQLTLLHGFSNYSSLEPITKIIQADPEVDTVERIMTAIPAPTFFSTLHIVVPQTDYPYEIEWTFFDNSISELSWIFRHNNIGDWSLTAIGERDSILRSDRGNSSVLNLSSGDEIGFSFWLTDRAFQIVVEQQVVNTLVLAPNMPVPTISDMTMTLNVLTDHTDPLLVPVRNLYLTTAFYHQHPVTAGAIAPSLPGERLYNYADAPLEIINELRRLKYIPPSGGGLVGNIPSGYIRSDAVGYTTFPLIERRFQNFVVGYNATLLQGNPETACGIIMRQQNEATFTTVLHTPARGIYFLQYQDGVLSEDKIAEFSPAILPGIGTENQIVVVAIEGRGWLFVNGRLTGSIRLNDTTGPILAHIVLPAADSAYCQYDDFWLWAFN